MGMSSNKTDIRSDGLRMAEFRLQPEKGEWTLSTVELNGIPACIPLRLTDRYVFHLFWW